MSSQFKPISNAYERLSSLYKNPTRNENSRHLDGVAAPNVNHDLMNRHRVLQETFNQHRAQLCEEDESLYYKVVVLLYEMDVYRGVESTLQKLIVVDCKKLIKKFANRPNHEGSRPFERFDFTKPGLRSEVKAKIRCCVAAIESRRREDNLLNLKDELKTLERFIRENLHLPKMPAWTTLALVLSAQARLARQAQNYKESQRKLLQEVRYLNNRAAEIIQDLFDSNETKRFSEKQIEDLKDDLMFIRRKQTLSNFFNVGLAAFQRGFLKTANQACRAARLNFRLHGQFFQDVFNELIILSIKRARTSRGQEEKFQRLKRQLENNILPHLNPDNGIGNPKLYLYSLRELAVLQYYCEETDDMIETLDLMEKLMKDYGLVRSQWESRIRVQRARAYWRNWTRQHNTTEPREALKHAQDAFTAASNLNKNIPEYPSATALSGAVKRSKRKSLIDTIESLVAYGSIQASAKQFAEAIKSATAVIELSGDDNPRLCAMGYLVRAEAYAERNQIVEAQRDVAEACKREARIDHCYIADRRKLVVRAIERYLPQPSLFLGDMDSTDFKIKGKYRLLGWFIETKTDKKSKSEIEEKTNVSRTVLDSYLKYLRENRSDPYHYLVKVLSKREEDR